MLKKIINKRNYIILVLIIILIIYIIFNNFLKTKEQSKQYYYFSENILVKIYSNKNMEKTFEKIDKIYQKYNKYYKGISDYDDAIEIIKYGEKIYKETDGLIDITDNKLIQNLSENKEYSFTTKIDNIQDNLDDINIDSIIGAYATNKVVEYLKKQNINSYIINENGNIVTGTYYQTGKYKISIQNKDDELINIVCLENKALAIKGGTDNFESYMVNPKTSSIAQNKLVVVIADSIEEANMIANTLYLTTEEEGRDFIKNYNAEALWQENEATYTSGFKKYVK